MILDPITTEVIGSAMLSITDEMSTVLERTAYSPNIKERADCSTGLFDGRGRVVAQSQRLPLHMGSLLGSVRNIHERFSSDELEPGDMFLVNDPYNGGGSHLPDFNLVAPIFWDERLVAYAANTAHHSDVGGMVAGSESADCQEIFQEGLRIPPVRLCAAGVVRDDIVEIVRLNSRVPHDRVGDLNAQIAANRTAERRIYELCARYGADALGDHIDALLRSTENRIRSRFTDIGSGSFSYVEEGDPLPSGEALRIEVQLQVVEGALHLDFTGTSEQIPWARNVPINALAATAFAVVKTLLDPEIAANDGLYRSIIIEAPPGCLVNPVPPAPVSARASTCGILADALVGVLSLAVPERAVAGSAPHQLITLAGEDPRTGDFFVNYETIAGAMGARADSDGWDAVRIYASGAANLLVEPLEQAFPLRIERYELIAEASGAGRARGGRGIRRDYRVLCDELRVGLTGERQVHAARGREGGSDGRLAQFIRNPGTLEEEVLPRIAREVVLRRGDVLRVETPGGGGFGPLEDRDVALVEFDRLQGRQ